MIAVAAGAVFLGAGLQSATGFGFALVAAPLLFAVLGPQEAVTAGVLLGLELNVMTLASEGRRPRVLRADAVTLVGWALPGLALGALALRSLPDRLLSAFVAVAVLAALGLRLRARRVRAVTRAARWWQPALAGASSGALATSTSLSGPPLVFYLLARGLSPEQMRDTLAAVFVALSLAGVPALLATGTFDVPAGVGWLIAAAAVGQVAGRRAFARLAGDRYEAAVLTLLAATALVALAASSL
ncbi:MAG TPA: sulfite exporter TauE/SafE family protein [Solirubrobacteraceae bacterium]|nr:sulfite exporter TauE/SafE family protein [Solirubrobacteraceae bacterium]